MCTGKRSETGMGEERKQAKREAPPSLHPISCKILLSALALKKVHRHCPRVKRYTEGAVSGKEQRLLQQLNTTVFIFSYMPCDQR